MRLILILLASAASLGAQRYGPSHTWWDAGQGFVLPWEEAYDNPDGQVSILNRNGAVQTRDHPFFEPLGRNRRACVTCHQPANGMSVSAAALRARWSETEGKDPIFAAIDGSNCPGQPQDSPASHALLLERGLFRIALPWPPKGVTPEFRIQVVRDPTGCNSSASTISVYRRPRVAANLQFLVSGPAGPALMADGREPTLRSQAVTAALIHEQAEAPPTEEQLRRIVDFEMQLFTAQSSDIRGGLLNEDNAPMLLGPQNVAVGKAAFTRETLPSFEVWRKPGGAPDLGLQREFRASVARGSGLFFGVKFNCAACHVPGTTRWMEIGTNNRPPDEASHQLPLFRVTCAADGRVIYTQDPGRALISGRCADVGAVVIQQLRGLAARAPYFANGSAQSLRDVVEYYDRHFAIGYSEREKQDLINFLRVL